MSAAFFALIPPASVVHVQEAGGGIAGLTPTKPKQGGKTGENGGGGEEDPAGAGGDADGDGGNGTGHGGGGDDLWGVSEDVEEELGAAGDPLLVRGRRRGEARERDQRLPNGELNLFAVAYLRCAKWGSRALCPLVFNLFVVILLEVCLYYDDTWTGSPNKARMTLHVMLSFALGLVVAAALSTRPVCMVLGWLLTPPVLNNWVFEDEDQAIVEGAAEPASPA